MTAAAADIMQGSDAAARPSASSSSDWPPLPVLAVSSASPCCSGAASEDSCEDSIVIVDPTPQQELRQFPPVGPAEAEAVAHMSPAEIHAWVCAQMPVPETFVDKLVAFHLGQLTLTVDDLTSYYLYLDARFARFAHHLPAFRAIASDNDRATLITANSPLYFQLHMSRYINAAGGLEQVKALLGPSLPEDLSDCTKFLTVSFRYFASALRLFSDHTWLDMYELKADSLRKSGAVSDEHQLAPCIIFTCDSKEHDNDRLDNVAVIKSAFQQALLSAAEYTGPKTTSKKKAKPTLTELIRSVETLKAMAHCYSGHANIHDSDEKPTNMSMTVLPSPDSAQEEENFWLRRQLSICENRSRREVNLGRDVVEALSLYYSHNQPLDSRVQSFIVDALVRRCHTYLWSHHEFRQLCRSPHQLASMLDGLCSQLSRNVQKATAFAVALFETLSPDDQLEFLLGIEDKDAYYSALPATRKKITLANPEVLQAYHVDLDLVESYYSVTKKLSSECSVTTGICDHFSCLISLVILWSCDAVSSPMANSYVNQVANIRDRYHLYAKRQLEVVYGNAKGQAFYNLLIGATAGKQQDTHS